MKLAIFYAVFAAAALAATTNAAPVANESADSIDTVVARSDATDASPIVERVNAVASHDVDFLPRRHKAALEKRTKAKATYYEGSQLDNPSCGGKTPSSSEHIAAVAEGSSFKCGDHIKLSKGSKTVTVKVVDTCASCSTHHFDLSTGAFKKLGPLSEGVIEDLNWEVTSS